MRYIWQCKQCGCLYEGSQLMESERDYGGIKLKERICPGCRSTLLTCISLNWRLNYVDNEKNYRVTEEVEYSDAESVIKRYIADVENLIHEQEK